MYLHQAIEFKTKTAISNKEWDYIMMKGSIQLKDITFANIYEPNIGAPIYLKQMLTDLREIQKCNNEETLIFHFHQ